MSQIPLVDLAAQMSSIREDVDGAIKRTLDHGGFILGPEVTAFEANFAAFCETTEAIGCGNGTDALHLAFRALGVGPGDEVILPAMTFVSTALGVSLTGAKPVLVDVRADDALIDCDRIAAAITPKTKAILPVHLYGQMADMVRLTELAKTHGLKLVEDAAQAHGATRDGKRAGSVGDLGCFSFYPGKNLGAYGDGGAVTTRDPELAASLRVWRNCGSQKKYHHKEMGLNSRLDSLHAGILDIKLRHLASWNDARRVASAHYDELLAGVGGVTLTQTNDGSVRHLYVVRLESSEKRDAVLERLHEQGIGAGIHYPFAIHQLDAYQWLGHNEGDFPEAERWAATCLSLPMYPELTASMRESVVDALKASLA